MRNLILIITLSIGALNIFAQSVNKQQIDSVWCIQLLSTRNIQLVKPEMLSAMDDNALVETAGDWSRVLVVCESKEQADMYLYSWQRQHREAFIVLRDRKQIAKMYPLFTWD